MRNVLNVCFEARLVGRLRLDEKRNFLFQYDPAWLKEKKSIPLSVRLPLREELFGDDICKPFFSNLLPEANVRALIAGQLGISEKNDFKLLEALGGECAGAFSLLPEGQVPATKGHYRLVLSDELDEMIDHMPTRPLLTVGTGVRLSLAGAQNKLPVFLKEQKIYLPVGSFSSSHILKPAIPHFLDPVENETFCMMLAAKVGLPVPKVSIWKGRHKAYLVERYDRQQGADGNWTRLHQEDFCQALGFSYDQKYESEGGPGLANCFSVLEQHSSQPIIDKRNFLQWIVFNYLIGNCDAHAKNASLLILENGVGLAPFYDLMSTKIYPQLSEKLGMKIGQENRLNWISNRHWERLAVEANVGVKAVTTIAKDLGTTLPGTAEDLAKIFIAEHGAKGTIERICGIIAAMCKKLLLNWDAQ